MGFDGGHTVTLAASTFVDRTLPMLVTRSKPAGRHRALPHGMTGYNGRYEHRLRQAWTPNNSRHLPTDAMHTRRSHVQRITQVPHF